MEVPDSLGAARLVGCEHLEQVLATGDGDPETVWRSSRSGSSRFNLLDPSEVDAAGDEAPLASPLSGVRSCDVSRGWGAGPEPETVRFCGVSRLLSALPLPI
jgi:hypothetical protein